MCANGATNVALVGEGAVDGRGWAIAGTERDNEPGRWKSAMFYRSKGVRVEGVTIRNVKLTLMGGGPASEVVRFVPEAEKSYPENRMFKRQMLPAYGFYVRHVDGVTFENVVLTYTGETEARPAIFLDDVTDIATEACTFRPRPAPIRRSTSGGRR